MEEQTLKPGRILGWVFALSWPFLIASAMLGKSWEHALIFNGLGMVGAGAGAAIAVRGDVQGLRRGPLSGYLLAAAFALVVWAPPAIARLVQGGRPMPVKLPLAALAGLVVLYPLMGLGEEVAWRGVLLPRLAALGERKAVALVGIIWGFWHAPLLAIAVFKAPVRIPIPMPPVLAHGLQALAAVAFLLVAEIPLSAIFAWFWGRYRSLAIMALLHGSYDGVRDGLGALMGSTPSGPARIASATTSVALLILGAGLLWRGKFGLAPERSGPEPKGRRRPKRS